MNDVLITGMIWTAIVAVAAFSIYYGIKNNWAELKELWRRHRGTAHGR